MAVKREIQEGRCRLQGPPESLLSVRFCHRQAVQTACRALANLSNKAALPTSCKLNDSRKKQTQWPPAVKVDLLNAGAVSISSISSSAVSDERANPARPSTNDSNVSTHEASLRVSTVTIHGVRTDIHSVSIISDGTG